MPRLLRSGFFSRVRTGAAAHNQDDGITTSSDVNQTDGTTTDRKVGAVVDEKAASSTGSDKNGVDSDITARTDGKQTAVTTDTEKKTQDETEESPADDDESQYMSGSKLVLLSIGLCLATFVIALDNTIIATAIPRITTEFDSLDDVGWYGSSYLLTTTSLQPPFGKVITYFSVKWVYLSALLIFERT